MERSEERGHERSIPAIADHLGVKPIMSLVIAGLGFGQ